MLLNQQSNDSTSKRALILAGGGMRVAYQAGVLRALEEEGLSYSHVDGTSGGTMNTAMLFSGVTPTEMCRRWSTLNMGDFVSFLPLVNYFKPHKLKAMGDADGIIDKVFPHLGIDVSKINRAHGCEATFNVCNHSTKQNLAIAHTDVTLPHLIAGISLPIFMPAIEIDGDMYTDSVWIKDANLMEAVKRGAEELWLVWCIGNSHDFKENSFLQYVHMIELSANGALLEEYDRILALNERIARGDSPYGQKKPIKLHVIKPPYPIPLDPDLYCGAITAQELVDMGYQQAKEYLHNRDEAGVKLDWQATMMKEPATTLVMRKSFTAITKNQTTLEFHLRAEAYGVNAATFTHYNLPLTLFANITLDGVCQKQSAATGKITLSTNEAEGPVFELSTEVDRLDLRLVGKIRPVPFWQMLLGCHSKIDIQLYKEGHEAHYDEAAITVSLWGLLTLFKSIQVKEAANIWQMLALKWKLAQRLLTRQKQITLVRREEST
ncbi:MAG: patatin-like phospholipase family protein [Candidatus Polarisedimenticolaceae bacterium]|nr:patatin-like phospholipase family protein [Candidatus Polarisedimenticolaceae bacterium]